MKSKGRFFTMNTCYQDLVVLVAGLTLVFASQLVPGLEPTFAWFLFGGGLCMGIFALGEMAVVLHWAEKFRALAELTKEHHEEQLTGVEPDVLWGRRWKDELKALHKRRAKHANSGIVWVWAVCLAGIVVYAIAFYTLLFPTLQLIGIVESMTAWDADAAFTLNLCKTVLNWHPILFIIGMLLWAFVNSVRREDVTYPYG